MATDVIEKLQAGWPKARIDELLPDAWAAAREQESPHDETTGAATPA